MTEPLDRFIGSLERELVTGIAHHHRRRTRVRLVAAGSAVVLLLLVALGLVATRDRSHDGAVVTIDRPPSTTVQGGDDGPSQSPADAARDHVMAAIANLPQAQRVRPLPAAPNEVHELTTPEGRWLISEPSFDSGVPGQPCLGDPSAGHMGESYVCPGAYTEILLLDGSGRILRAYPFVGGGPRSLVLSDSDGIYCAGQGDGGYPDSVLCRIFRKTGEISARVFAFDNSVDPVDTSWYPAYPWLSVGETYTEGRIGSVRLLDYDGSGPFGHLRVNADGTIGTGGPQGPRFDPVTLQPLAP